MPRLVGNVCERPSVVARYPEATAIVKKILKCYKEGARDWERINE